MKTRFLFPHRYRHIGWIIAPPAFVLMLFNLHGEFNFKFLNYVNAPLDSWIDKSFLFNLRQHNFTDELGSLLLIAGLLLIAFSREKVEDERIAELRLESLLWAVYVNFAWLIFSIIFFYNGLFLQIITYNICTPLILFIIRYNVVMYNERKNLKKSSL
ncbi:MAG: hypothetical protein J0H74_21170 [Chitinophagaceae bacterium]|nr:hypothetical protein [Chitinophagaceae bacterium]